MSSYARGGNIPGVPGFGGLGTSFREPEGCSPFTGYGGVAWDPAGRRPTTVMGGFLNA